MKIKPDSGASAPVRAHGTDAGADPRPPAETVVPARRPRIIDTGVHIRLPHGCVGMPKGRPSSDKAREKMSEARKGKKASEHVIPAMTEAAGKKAPCAETGKAHKPISEAGGQLGISSKAISDVCRGKSKTSGGYRREYAEEPR